LTTTYNKAPQVQTADAKQATTLSAQFAIAGHSVHRLADGGFIVCKHGYAKHCPDIDALAAFAKQTGVTR
jgi:hypothetical protein